MVLVRAYKEEHIETLKDKDIILIPDCDDAGVTSKEKQAIMLFGKAKSIKIVRLPYEHGSKRDVNDYLDEHTKDEFDELVCNTPVLTEEIIHELKKKHGLFTLEELIDGVKPGEDYESILTRIAFVEKTIDAERYIRACCARGWMIAIIIPSLCYNLSYETRKYRRKL